MTNPFEAFDISDDEEQQFTQTKKENTRKSHKERRQLRKQPTQETTNNTPQQETQLPERHKDNQKLVRHNNQGRPEKGVPAGHPLDRRSGTGREDRPRKQGGGRGNIGNVRDELNSDKYQRPQQQVPATTEQVKTQTVQQTKPQEPQGVTLQEYYKNRGVDFTVTSGQRNAPVKNKVDADWLKKQKLTLVETKEDKKKLQTVKQNIATHTNTRVQLQIGNSQLLGFGQKTAPKPREQEHQTDYKEKGHHHHKGKRGPKVVLKEDDFPTL